MLVHASGFNLGLVMRRLVGVRTPRGLQGRLAAIFMIVLARYDVLIATLTCSRADWMNGPAPWCNSTSSQAQAVVS